MPELITYTNRKKSEMDISMNLEIKLHYTKIVRNLELDPLSENPG